MNVCRSDAMNVILRDTDTNEVIGITTALPISAWGDKYFNADAAKRDDDGKHTAYCLLTVIDEKRRNNGLVWKLIKGRDELLQKRGYEYIETDAVTRYANKLQEFYGDQVVAAEESVSPQQKFLRIKLKAVADEDRPDVAASLARAEVADRAA